MPNKVKQKVPVGFRARDGVATPLVNSYNTTDDIGYGHIYRRRHLDLFQYGAHLHARIPQLRRLEPNGIGAMG
ncbi:hypothetical protein [Acidithiobacillus sp.]|uniref:hypothetical protein n=1 Tax=Acidithiobacillus sp. TaxID=1872118 RepID=UPI0025B95D94|nr:hypothetical protein [Acidithiobacillus sp.]MCK9359937.1 hypothetical protein [Acidithiobacillus sp.]